MRSVLAIAASFTPVLSVGLWSLSGHADSRNFVLADLPPLPSLSEKVDLDDEQPDKTVVFRLNRTTSLVQLAASLDLDPAMKPLYGRSWVSDFVTNGLALCAGE